MPTVGRRRPLGRSLVERAHENTAEARSEFARTSGFLDPLSGAPDVFDAALGTTSSNAGTAGEAADGPQPRNWAWVFGALFEAARATELGSRAAPHAASNLGSMALKLPETLLFDTQGWPTKWLGTGTGGRVVRRSFNVAAGNQSRKDPRCDASASLMGFGWAEADAAEEVVAAQMVEVSRGFATFAASLRKDLKPLLDSSAFGHAGSSSSSSGGGSARGLSAQAAAARSLIAGLEDEDPPWAVAWYTDGQREVLKRRMFEMVTQQPAWRKQVLGLQAYVPCKKAKEGKYETTAHRLSRRAPLSLSPAHDMGTTALTTALAQFSERAYSDLADQNMALGAQAATGVFSGRQDEYDVYDAHLASSSSRNYGHGSGGGGGRSGDIMQTTVAHMAAHFIVDPNDTLWFSHCDEMKVSLKPKRNLEYSSSSSAPPSRPTTNHAQGTSSSSSDATASAVSAVGAELKHLCLLASSKGVSVALSFNHFDERGTGLVDADQLVDGLARLGVGVSDAAAEELVATVSRGGAPFFRCSDLEAYVHSEGTDDKTLQQLERRDGARVGSGGNGDNDDTGDFDVEEDWGPNDTEGGHPVGQAQTSRDAKGEWSSNVMRTRQTIVDGGSYYGNIDHGGKYGEEGNFDDASAQDRMHTTTGLKRGAKDRSSYGVDGLLEDGAGETHYDGGAAAHFARIEDEKAHVLLGTTLAPGRGADPRFGHSWDVATSAQRKGMVGASDLTSYDEASNFSGDNSQNLYHSSSNRTNLSPGQLDRRDAPALIALASHGYGAEGEYRSKPGNNRVLGLEERSELATARDMQRYANKSTPALSDSARASSHATLKLLNYKHDAWQQRKRAKESQAALATAAAKAAAKQPPSEAARWTNAMLEDSSASATNASASVAFDFLPSGEETGDSGSLGSRSYQDDVSALGGSGGGGYGGGASLKEDDDNDNGSLDSLAESVNNPSGRLGAVFEDSGERLHGEDADGNREENGQALEVEGSQVDREKSEDDDELTAASEGHDGDDAKAGAPSQGKEEQEDELYHADYGVVVSWRLLEGKPPAPHAATAADGIKFEDRSNLSQRAYMEDTARLLTRGGPPMRESPFLLIALPDATMTLEALAVGLQPLLAKHPQGGILLLGLPGLPNTSWPAQQPLTAPHQARAAAALLAHLISSGGLSREKYLKPGVPVFWLGIGNGVPTLFQLASQHLQPSPSPVSHHNHSDHDPLRLLREQTVLFTTVNGFAHVEKSLKKATMSLQRLLLRGTYHERLAALTMAHFGDNFVAEKAQELRQRAQRLLTEQEDPGFTGEGRASSSTPANKFSKSPKPDDFGRRARGAVLRQFWASRRRLVLEPPPGFTELSTSNEEGGGDLSPLSPSVAKAAGSFLALRSRRSAGSSGNGEVKKQFEDQQQQQDKEDNDDDGTTSSGSEGLHATLRGMAQQPDLRRDLARLPAPLLLLASSEDRWVLPTHSDGIFQWLTNLSANQREADNSESGSSGSSSSSTSSVNSGSSSRSGSSSSTYASSTMGGLRSWVEAETPQELVLFAAGKVLAQFPEPEPTLSADPSASSSNSSSAAATTAVVARPSNTSGDGSVKSGQSATSSRVQFNAQSGLIAKLTFRAGHELLQEKHTHIVGLFSDLVTSANEVYHPHLERLRAMHAARLRAEEQEAAAKALKGGFGTTGQRGAFSKQGLGRSKSSRSRSPSGGAGNNASDDYLDVLEAVDAYASEARDLAQQNNSSATKMNVTGAKSSSGNNSQQSAAVPAGPLSAEAQMAALAAGLSDSDSDDDDDLTASTDGGRLNAAERSAAEAANLEKKAARAQQAAERKIKKDAQRKKKEAKQREADAAKLREIEEVKMVAKRVQVELVLMRRADKESAAMMNYEEDMEQWEVAAEDARKKAHELSQARIDDEARTLEFMAARLRSTKHEQRVKRLREEEERMEREALSVGDGKVGGYSFLRPDKSVDLNLCGVACAKLVNDLFEARQKLVGAFRRQVLAQAQYDTFKKQYDERAEEVRALSVGVRQLEREITLGNDSPGSAAELARFKKDYDKALTKLNELESLFKAREKIIKSANRIVQGLKLVVKERKEACEVGIHQVSQACLDLLDKIGEWRLATDHEELEKKHRKDLLHTMLERKAEVARELKHTARHTGKYINTSTWNAGVRQRMETKQLYEHLAKEYRTLKASCADLVQMQSESQDRCMRMSARMIILDAQGNFVKSLKSEIEKCYARACARTIIDELKLQDERAAELEARHVKLAQERELVEAAKAQTAKAKGKEIPSISFPAPSSSSAVSLGPKKNNGQNGASSGPSSSSSLDSPGKAESIRPRANLTESGGEGSGDNVSLNQPSTLPHDSSAMLQNLTRLKASEKRSKEEKMWIALDALLNPEYYANNVSEQEVEEMTYDLDYQIWQRNRMKAPGQLGPLTRSEVEAILALPRSAVEAMPFLKDDEAVEMHRLLTKYTLGRGEDFQRNQDAKSQDTPPAPEDSDTESDDDDEQDNSDSEAFVDHEALGGYKRPAKVAITEDMLQKEKNEVDAHVKGCRVERIRSTPPGLLNSEQRMWVILDRILCPEHYFFDFRDAVDHDGRRSGGFAPAPSNPEAPKMGDIYVHQRWEYEQGFEASQFDVALDTGWVCPYDEKLLLELHKAPAGMLKSDEDRMIRYLMDRYYVLPELTAMGIERRAATQALLDATAKLAEAQLAAELEHEEALRRGEKQRRRSSIRSPTTPVSPGSAAASSLAEPSSAKRRSSVLSPTSGGGKKEPLSSKRRESLSPLTGNSKDPLSPGRQDSLSPLTGSRNDPLSLSSPLKGLEEEDEVPPAPALTLNPRGRASAPKVLRSASERAARLPVALLRQESGAGGAVSPSKQHRGSMSPSSPSLSPLQRRNTLAILPSPSKRRGSGLGGVGAKGTRSRRFQRRSRAGFHEDFDDDEASAGEVDDEESDVSDEDMAWDRTRIWGAWEAVHPAALGRKSQREAFPWHDPVRFEGGTGRHPASYSLRPPMTHAQAAAQDAEEALARRAKRKADRMAARKREKAKELAAHKASLRPEMVVVANIEELGLDQSHKPALMPTGQIVTLLEAKNVKLGQRQSRAHMFEIGLKPPKGGASSATPGLCLQPGQHILDLTVSITFEGTFGARGYQLGRIAASLYRLPLHSDPAATPVTVGWAPYALQARNLPSQFGKVTILHEPSAVPVLAQPFQVVVGAVSAAEYSITVSGRLAEEGKVAVERLLKHAKEVQAVVPELTGDLEDLWNSLRLFERKLLVVKEMMAKARNEALRCERDMEMCYDELHADDRFPIQEQLLDESDRADIYAEIRTLEVEFAHWARIYTVRAKERDDTYEMLGRLGENRREILVRKTKIVHELAQLRSHVPAAIGNVMGLAAATEAALTLNTSFQPSDNHRSKWSRVADMNKVLPRTVTPADEVRKRHKSNGIHFLNLDEKQWIMLDKSLNPDLYTWEELAEEAERAKHKLACDRARELGVKLPKRRAVQRLNHAVRSYQYSKQEIERILNTSTKKLNRRELSVRRLMTRFHDNPQLLRAKADAKGKHAGVGHLFGHHGGSDEPFDPMRGQRTRVKHEEDWTTEEIEWISIDKIINPEVWATLAGKSHGGMEDDTHPPSKAELRQSRKGFTKPFPLEPELEAEMSREDDIKAAEDRAARKLKRLNLSGGSKGTRTPSPGSALAIANGAATAATSSSLVPVGNALQAVGFPSQKKQGGFGGFGGLVAAAVHEQEEGYVDSGWRCPFTKEECLQIWSHDLHTTVTSSTPDERKVHQLLIKYNGAWEDYQSWLDAVAAREHAKQLWDSGVGGVNRYPMEPLSFEEGGPGDGENEGRNVDLRARLVLAELDKAANNSNGLMASAVLHGYEQKYPTNVLRVELERELDETLRKQVELKERAEMEFLVVQDPDEQEEAEDDEEENSQSSPVHAATAAEAASVKVIDDGFGDDEEARLAEKRFKQLVKKRARIRKEGRGEVHGPSLAGSRAYKEEVQRARYRVDHDNNVDYAQHELESDFRALGFGACRACMTNPCKWKPLLDLKEYTARRQELSDELHFVKMNPEQESFDTIVPISVRRGGPSNFRREALEFTLMYEDKELERDIRLCKIDQECHDAFASTKQYFETTALNGFRALLWTENARKGLEEEHSRLVASQVASDLVEEVLLGMREGWYFGEVESKFKVQGYVPSIDPVKKVRILKAPEKLVEDEDVIEDLDDNGIPDEALEDDPKWQISDRTVVQPGDHRDQALTQSEQSIRFGLFTLTFMYFRAMHLMKKQKKMWLKEAHAGAEGGSSSLHDDSDDETSPENDPELQGKNPIQRRIVAEKRAAHEAKVAKDMGSSLIGQARSSTREAQEKDDAGGNLVEKVKLENQEREALSDLQRLYRGHIGRKAARRWAMKRAEMSAHFALISTCAITAQRVFRGYLGKCKSSEMRAEMAEFISMIRLEDSVNDENEYWKKHTWARLKRDMAAAAAKVRTAATGIPPAVDVDDQ